MIFMLNSCTQEDPSIVKIFVRSNSNELIVGAKVIIIADLQADEDTKSHVDTVITNSAGYATFYLDDYYKLAGEGNDVTFFDIVVKTTTKTASGYIRSRAHTTAVETVFLPN